MSPRLPDRRRWSEDAVATIWCLAWVFVCFTVGWIGIVAAAIVAAQHRLDAAADLSSLSAAARLQRGEDACTTADRIAEDDGVVVRSCQVTGLDVVVTVDRLVALPFGMHGHLSSTARAGP
jgi:secretion/DNA translocation related TadE-like protein